MKYIIIALILLIPSRIKYQTILNDTRDGNTYKIVKINNLYWMAEDLRYVTPKSWCAEKKSRFCDKTNFYSHTELDSICPCEWRLPNTEEWLAALEEIHQLNPNAKDSLDWEIYTGVTKEGRTVTDYQVNKFPIFKDEDHLKIQQYGWVQGKKREDVADKATYWLSSDLNDLPHHIHFHPERTLLHSHEHHILDKPKNVRRFQIRCVKEAN